uniref:Uncharacterized protein n=1 Tax=Avena sativa TaxID=4498 RepID=A0ACD5YII9_AVESA
MATMQQSHLLFHIFLLLAAARVVAGGGRTSSVIRSTCAAVAKSPVSTTYAYCVQTLISANPAASAMDARGLATIATELTMVNITKTIDVVNELISTLQGCVLTYQEMQGFVASALDDIHAGRLRPASDSLKVASWQPDYCDLDLIQINKDPLIDENHDNHLLSRLASNVAGVIAPPPPPRPVPPPLPA